MNKVALLLPHYNNASGLQRSIASIHPTDEVDVFIVDDGSAVSLINEQEVRQAFKAKGALTFIYLEANRGIEHALNTGLKQIVQQGYTFIARLDSDDQCIGPRFTLQQHFLESNTDIMLVGSNAHAVDTDGKFLYNIIVPETSAAIAKKMFLNSMFLHPSVMFRAAVVNSIGLYPLNYKAAEDYAYFFAITRRFKTANLQEFLINYEINPNGISLSRRKQQVRSRLKVLLHNFYFGFYPVYGLLRNTLLYIIPNSFILFLKRQRKQ